MLTIVYVIINLFINKNFMIALLVLYFNLLCSCATSDLPSLKKNFYDVIVFSSSDFALVLGVESFEKQQFWPEFCNLSMLLENTELNSIFF